LAGAINDLKNNYLRGKTKVEVMKNKVELDQTTAHNPQILPETKLYIFNRLEFS
jgi:hypothetical protein